MKYSALFSFYIVSAFSLLSTHNKITVSNLNYHTQAANEHYFVNFIVTDAKPLDPEQYNQSFTPYRPYFLKYAALFSFYKLFIDPLCSTIDKIFVLSFYCQTQASFEHYFINLIVSDVKPLNPEQYNQSFTTYRPYFLKNAALFSFYNLFINLLCSTSDKIIVLSFFGQTQASFEHYYSNLIVSDVKLLNPEHHNQSFTPQQAPQQIEIRIWDLIHTFSEIMLKLRTNWIFFY